MFSDADRGRVDNFAAVRQQQPQPVSLARDERDPLFQEFMTRQKARERR